MLGLKGDFSAQPQPAGLHARWRGDLRVADLRLQQARQIDGERVIGDDLLIWPALNLKGLKLTLAPGAATQLDIADAGLNDFFARLIINEQGRFIRRDLGPQEMPERAQAAAARPPIRRLKLSFGQTRFFKGKVDFPDRFVRPNSSAPLSDLQGSLSVSNNRFFWWQPRPRMPVRHVRSRP